MHGDREWSVLVFDPETLAPRASVHVRDDVTWRVDGAARLFALFPSGRSEAWDLRDGRALGNLPASPEASDLLRHLRVFAA